MDFGVKMNCNDSTILNDGSWEIVLPFRLLVVVKDC
jgi:hypothetical protein